VGTISASGNNKMINVTGSTFIRNVFDGGFPLFESMCAVLAITDSLIVVDMGSTDGTLEVLEDIAKHNNRLTIKHAKWTCINPQAFADIANECVALCPTDNVYFWQADEILHETLAKKVREFYEQGIYEMSFERIQLSHGGHVVKWLPHQVCRSLTKGKRYYDKDGMSVNDHGGTVMMCLNPDNGHWNESRGFKWHEPKPGIFFDNKNPTSTNEIMNEVFPWEYFLVDTSSMFRDCQAGKKALHCAFWGETASSIEGKSKDQWIKDAAANPLWSKKEPSFTRLPKLVNGLVGMTKYELRPEVLQSLKADDYTAWGL
jgi:hypothetical protein